MLSIGIRSQLLFQPAELEGESDQALLRAVVQVSFEPLPLPLAGSDDSQWFYAANRQKVGPVTWASVKALATGFEVTGTIRNLSDGRVELVAEGTKEELEAFRRAIQDCEVGRFIRHEDVSWSEAMGQFRGFEIVS